MFSLPPLKIKISDQLKELNDALDAVEMMYKAGTISKGELQQEVKKLERREVAISVKLTVAEKLLDGITTKDVH